VLQPELEFGKKNHFFQKTFSKGFGSTPKVLSLRDIPREIGRKKAESDR